MTPFLRKISLLTGVSLITVLLQGVLLQGVTGLSKFDFREQERKTGEKHDCIDLINPVVPEND